MALNVTPEDLFVIKKILSNYNYTFYAFGSRVRGTNHPYSDLDLCYKEEIPQKQLDTLKAAFEKSGLPYEIDLMDWHMFSEVSKKQIKKEMYPV